jgi:hypothetical protein
MMLAAKMDELGRGAWIAAMVLGFCLWWPVGLATLAFLGFTGRLRRAGWVRDGWGRPGWDGATRGHWHNMDGGCGWGRRGRARWGGGGGPSGNQAFDDYRAETLRRLEEEQQEFQSYLERLRRAKDKAEFDQFMAERRGGRTNGAPTGYPPGETV